MKNEIAVIINGSAKDTEQFLNEQIERGTIASYRVDEKGWIVVECASHLSAYHFGKNVAVVFGY